MVRAYARVQDQGEWKMRDLGVLEQQPDSLLACLLQFSPQLEGVLIDGFYFLPIVDDIEHTAAY